MTRKGYKRREREDEELTDLGDEVTLMHATRAAILIEIDGDEYWVPKSLVRDGSDAIFLTTFTKGGKGTLVIPEWFAKKEHIV